MRDGGDPAFSTEIHRDADEPTTPSRRFVATRWERKASLLSDARFPSIEADSQESPTAKIRRRPSVYSGQVSINSSFVKRLTRGGLKEEEQRWMASRLLSRDPEFRNTLRAILRPFEGLDVDLMGEYQRALQKRSGLENARQDIVQRAFARSPGLETRIQNFRFDDMRLSGDTAPKIFSWTMAEHLILTAQDPSANFHQAKVKLYLATMITDALEILGLCRHIPLYPEVLEDLRRRVRRAWALLEEKRG